MTDLAAARVVTAEPLEGTRVLLLGRGDSAAAACARRLSDHGAAVVSQGNGTTRESLLDAADHADALVVDAQGLALLDRHGVDLDRIAAPVDGGGRVVAVVTAFGRAHARRPASELTVQAETGLLAVTGHPDGPPVRVGVPLSAEIAGSIACGAVLSALLRRAASGRGALLDLAEFDAMVMMQGNFLPGYLHSGRVPARAGNVQLLSAPWNAYAAADGQVIIAAISESLWRKLLDAIGHGELAGRPEYAGKVNRVALRAEIDALITEWTSARPAAEAAAILRRAGLPVGEVRTVGQMLDSSLSQERQVVRREGGHLSPGSPVALYELPPGEASAPRPEADLAPSAKPLAGIRVLEIGGHTAGGLATRMLADLGADVIKVELPQGDNARTTAPILSDGNAYLWHFWNVGKRSMVLDFTEERGHEVLRDLVAVSDVVLQNMALDTVEKLHIGPEDLAPGNARLVYCGVSGFGLTGSDRYRRAFDAVLQAEAGIMSLTGTPDAPPVKAGPSVVDNGTALAAVTGILAALIGRERRRGPLVVDAALYNTATALTTELWPFVEDGQEPLRTGNRHPRHPLHDVFVSTDGGLVAVAATTPDETTAARELFGLGAAVESWNDQVAARAADMAADEMVSRCCDAGVPAARVLGIAELVTHPLVAERGMLLPLEIGAHDTCTTIGTPYKFVDEPPMLAQHRRVPALGEHTDELLTGLLGYPQSLVDELRRLDLTAPHPH